MPKLSGLADIYPVFSRADWGATAFSLDKAFVCSVFSEWAYASIPDWELKDARLRRFKLFSASSVFDELVRNQTPFNFQEFLRAQEVRVLEVADDNNLLVAVAFYRRIQAQDVVFVSIRGTTNTYLDIATDITARPLEVLMGVGAGCRFHMGFYYAVTQSFAGLLEAIRKQAPPGSLIYVTGHSLGAALAGMQFGLWNRSKDYLKIHSAYAFAMPRYGDEETMQSLDNPYHLLNPSDLVPKVPLRSMGFADSLREYSCISGNPIKNRKERKGDRRVGLLQALRSHKIDCYIGELKKFVK